MKVIFPLAVTRIRGISQGRYRSKIFFLHRDRGWLYGKNSLLIAVGMVVPQCAEYSILEGNVKDYFLFSRAISLCSFI